MIGRVDESPAEHDHHHDDRQLGDDDDVVDEGRLAGAADEQRRTEAQDEHGRNVHHPVHAVRHLERRVAPLIRDVHPDVSEHPVEACSLHAIATVAAPMAYSSTRSQPMIHAMNSPIVAYEYV